MSYKSYAQPGQFGNYYIDLPIKAEINEDLRAAGNFAKQMELSQKYREKWAGSYLTALNEKSSIERQNRDDNFEFLQNNFKRIHEGEQREFQARLEEAERQRHEDAKADPSFIEQLVPFLLEVIPQAASVVGAINQSKLEGEVALANDVITKTGITPAQLGAQQRFAQLPDGVVSLSDKAQVAAAFHRNHASNVSAGDLQKVLEMTGEAQMHSQLVAWRNDRNRVATDLNKISAVGSGERFDPSLPEWRSQQAKYTYEFQKYTQEVINDSWGNNSRQAYSDEVNFGKVQKDVRSIQNGIFNKNYNVWETLADGHNKQHIANQLDTALGLGAQAIQTHFDSRVKHFSTDPKLTPQKARLEAVDEFSANWLKGSGTHPQYVEWRAAYDAQKAADFNKKNGTKGLHPPRGGPVDDALDRLGLAIQERDNKIQRTHNTTLKNHQENATRKFEAKYGEIYKKNGPVAAADFLKQAQGIDNSANPILARKINGLITSNVVLQPYVKPTFAQRSGISQADLDRAATDVAIGGLPTTAANDALGAAKLAKLNGNRIAIDKIKGHMQANWDAYVRKYAGILKPGSEEFLQQAAFDSHQVMSKAGALPITNPDGKDATAVSAYNFQVGTNNINNKTVEYNELTKQKPKEYHPLYATDRLQFENYGKSVRKVIQMGGDINAPDQFQARVNLHNMPAVIERAETLGITKDESLDQILENLGYPLDGVKTFTEADRNTNSEILNRLHNNYKLTTYQGRQATIDARDNQLQPASHVQSSLGLSNMSATSALPVSGQVTGYSRYNPPAGRLRGIQGATLKFTDEDWYYIANAVQGEAGPDDDMFYVAANIGTRMAIPGAYGSTAKQVVTPTGQYVGYAHGKRIDQNLMNRLRSPEGQARIAEAMKHLDGRESFKGRDLYHNMGEGDIRPNDRSNYYHYATQGAGKHIKYNSSMAHDYWKNLVNFSDNTYGTGMQSNPPHYTEKKRWF